MSAVHRKKPEQKLDQNNFWCPPPNPSTSRHQGKHCQSQKARNDDKALQTTEPSRAPNRRIGGKRTAPKCVIRLVKWIEFKPGRSTGPTENNRSSRSSDDLSKEEIWPTRTVAVALVGVRRSEDEGRASHGKRKNAVPAGGLNPVRYENTPLSPARRAPHAPDGTRGLSATSPQMA